MNVKYWEEKCCYGCYFNTFVSHFPKPFPSLGYLETLLDHQYTCLFLSCPKITIKRAVMVAKSHAWFFPSHFQSKYFISFPQGPPPYKAIIEIIKIEAIKLLLLTGLPIPNIDRHWSFIHQLFKHSKIWGWGEIDGITVKPTISSLSIRWWGLLWLGNANNLQSSCLKVTA